MSIAADQTQTYSNTAEQQGHGNTRTFYFVIHFAFRTILWISKLPQTFQKCVNIAIANKSNPLQL